MATVLAVVSPAVGPAAAADVCDAEFKLRSLGFCPIIVHTIMSWGFAGDRVRRADEQLRDGDPALRQVG
jgi:hypothetical protein